ncbi:MULTISPECIES: 8-amino-7-oxononanoate synthase [unclassified Saccharibacter]|uniref:aminotransferase class I/II-fold pyridoxal phosphate-dependent enzyme n=1 Tax=unclassified Saccharibacter TaxID=2648722 RepID=UPI0013296F05|nr:MULTISPECIES: 8-amino-7-oxononanoate synthase [unclassified Saccharibacter]MXV36773.1 aminotransferase class I/II-fold pyridoxal phosphate-dependent enzyme [Saccharibacter sp. EH611]MXV58265.1 aminotransferase class I/II-fold pyridoxal phosphate-dependent enzyme [Saccharibacter sp. EH70]MXV65721.1 aminotransferase class I/II-fold pyridoxal phosphate-dependent enzyme [Saccharibacter sp. EH60]
MSLLDQALHGALVRRDRNHTRRHLTAVSRQGLLSERRGRTLVDVSSNDTLGLSDHPLLCQRAAQWAETYGTGARASRLVTGTLDLHLQLEDTIAAFKQSEAALLFATGWQANASILPALCALSKQETGHPARVFMDKLNHASLHQGCLSAGIRQIRFRHNDLAHLEEQLNRHNDKEGLAFIITESVFSMDGDRADLAGLRQLADRFNAFLYVDEAHATGVFGSHGQGLSTGFADITLSTASKALGGMGAFVTGSRALCDYLLNHASGFIYSTALPPAVLGALDAALEVVPTLDDARASLLNKAEKFRTTMQKAGWCTGASSTHIVPLLVGESHDALALAQTLENEGFLAMAIRPPTVPPHTARLRLSFDTRLTDDALDRLTVLLTRHVPKTRPACP